jgi:hypothetical protein
MDACCDSCFHGLIRLFFSLRQAGKEKGKEACLTRLARCCPNGSYLVDPASSHMLVSKIKPCMSKYKQICTVKLRMAH